VADTFRDLLFGDVPAAEWPPPGADHAAAEPWSSFLRAQVQRGKSQAEAVLTLRGILETTGLESRHYLQAWHELRELGVAPDAALAKQVLGVVVEVPVETGLDVLAAYLDGTARYLNYSGAAVIWEHPSDTLDAEVGALLEAGHAIATRIGPWKGPRLVLPPGQMRLSILTPSGLHFGQAPFETLSRDALGGRAIQAAMALMQRLIELRK
jgi:hypothetical protein